MSPPQQRSGGPGLDPGTAATNLQAETTTKLPDQHQGNPHVDQCDFCGQWLTGRHVLVQTTEFTWRTRSGDQVLYEAGWWAACHSCTPLMRGRQWRDLATRVIRVQLAGDPAGWCLEHVLRGELVALWLMLEQHLTGQERGGQARRRYR